MNRAIVIGILVLTVLASGCIASPQPGPYEPNAPDANGSAGAQADDTESPESPEAGQESDGQTASPPSGEDSNPFSGVTP
jgi:hypothetical protein